MNLPICILGNRHTPNSNNYMKHSIPDQQSTYNNQGSDSAAMYSSSHPMSSPVIDPVKSTNAPCPGCQSDMHALALRQVIPPPPVSVPVALLELDRLQALLLRRAAMRPDDVRRGADVVVDRRAGQAAGCLSAASLVRPALDPELPAGDLQACQRHSLRHSCLSAPSRLSAPRTPAVTAHPRLGSHTQKGLPRQGRAQRGKEPKKR
eukprot:767552-Hanusia_phi.AAC.1